ncbi:ATP-binding cassette domain-containing protein [Nocardia sp. CT2-14]|uniref:ATP-binding cassette domain-containing protein n=1 Tax=Nocardia aurantiaca TaxID=2675850 RepID=A0A6I3KR71_9NOCA|nr:ATP-binding cassette domain-containing protein [Nocardia aurantiaca]
MARPVDPRLWRHARSARSYLGLSVGLSLVTTGCIVIAALALARVLAGVITAPEHRRIGSWTVELVIFALAVLCRVAATWWQSRLAHRAGAQVVAELETAALNAGAQLPPRALESRRTELAVVVGSGLSGLRAYLAGYLPALLLAALVPPVVLAMIAAHDWVSGLIILVTLPLIPIFMILIGLLTQGKSADTLAATTRLSDQLLDLFAGMPTLRALGRETGRPASGAAGAWAVSTNTADAEGDHGARQDDSPRSMAGRVRELGDVLHRRTMSALRLAFLSSMVLEMLATLCVALVAVSIGMRLVFGHMGLYAGLLALILAPEVYLPLRAVGERFHAAQDGMAAADKAFAILEPGAEQAPITEAGSPAPQRTPATHRNLHGHIDIRDLAVRSRDGSAPAGLSATLRPSTVTALTGPNGCGKSTALQAILGLLTPDAGNVLVDGVPVAALDLDDWWSRIAWLPQRPVLIPGTLRANLELLGPPSGPDQVDAACVATGFDAVLDTLPARWDTVVGTGGLGLSLGQRQRLALTRTLAAPRDILLLDEPTAHLDDTSEAKVLAALAARAHAGATVVVVAHRPSVLAVADHIVEVRATTSARPSHARLETGLRPAGSAAGAGPGRRTTGSSAAGHGDRPAPGTADVSADIAAVAPDTGASPSSPKSATAEPVPNSGANPVARQPRGNDTGPVGSGEADAPDTGTGAVGPREVSAR